MVDNVGPFLLPLGFVNLGFRDHSFGLDVGGVLAWLCTWFDLYLVRDSISCKVIWCVGLLKS